MPGALGNPKIRHGRYCICFDVGGCRGGGWAGGEAPDLGSAISFLGWIVPDADRASFFNGVGGGNDSSLHLESARLDGVSILPAKKRFPSLGLSSCSIIIFRILFK